MSELLKKAKDLIQDGKLKEAIDLIKSVARALPGKITMCPSCGADSPTIEKSTQEYSECPKCHATWGKHTIGAPLIKYNGMGNQTMTLTKKDIVDRLWSFYQNGDPEVEAFDIQSFEATGWLKKNLATKLGLQIPVESDGEDLKKTEELEKKRYSAGAQRYIGNKVKFLMETEGKTQHQAVGQAMGMARQRGLKVPLSKNDDLTKEDILDLLLQMFNKGEEKNIVTRNAITKYEVANEINEDVLKAVYRKAGVDFYDLNKKSGGGLVAEMDIHHPKEVRERFSSAMMADPNRKVVEAAEKQGKKVAVHYSHTPFGKVVHRMDIHDEAAKSDVHPGEELEKKIDVCEACGKEPCQCKDALCKDCGLSHKMGKCDMGKSDAEIEDLMKRSPVEARNKFTTALMSLGHYDQHELNALDLPKLRDEHGKHFKQVVHSEVRTGGPKGSGTETKRYEVKKTEKDQGDAHYSKILHAAHKMEPMAGAYQHEFRGEHAGKPTVHANDRKLIDRMSHHKLADHHQVMMYDAKQGRHAMDSMGHKHETEHIDGSIKHFKSQLKDWDPKHEAKAKEALKGSGLDRAAAQLGKAAGDSDFLDDKKEHLSQKRGPLKPVIVKKLKKTKK